MSIILSPVTDSNRAQIEALKVKGNQKDFIETTVQCLKESDELSLWRPVGIYDNTLLIGFAMYGLWIYEGENGRVWLDRFLIDERYQHQGYGEKVLMKLINEIFNQYKYDNIFLSLYDTNRVAEHLYLKFGFSYNGELDINGENVMMLNKRTFVQYMEAQNRQD